MDSATQFFPITPKLDVQEQLRAHNVFGLFPTVSSAPTGAPNKSINQIQIFRDATGTILRLYWFDAKNAEWHYVTATA